MAKHDLFISHAYEDKGSFVRELADNLGQLGLRVWYDEYSLSFGDGLSASIDKGLKGSRYGIVVLTRNFFEKSWAQYEYRSLVALEAGRPKKILPVWYGVSREEVLRYSPHLADKVACVATGRDPMTIALEIMRVASPRKFTTLARAVATRQYARDNSFPYPPEELVPGPLREPLSQAQLVRIKLTHEALMEVFPSTWEETAGNFQRDIPEARESEIGIWEKIAGCYIETSREYPLSMDEKKRLFSALLDASLGQWCEDSESAPEWLVRAVTSFSKPLRNAKE